MFDMGLASTYEFVVAAADGLGGAGGPTDTDDREGRAGQTNWDINALDDDTQETQKGSNGGGGGLVAIQQGGV